MRSITRENAVGFINLKGYPNFFKDLNTAFPIQTLLHQSKGWSQLKVENVGDFIASFVPSPGDFGRIDPRFRVSASAFEKLPQYSDYGFVVFQLKEKSGTPHPMAFEFPTRMTNRLFFPTVHIHDGEFHKKDEFDHALYFQDDSPHRKNHINIAGQLIEVAPTQGSVDIVQAQGIVRSDAPLRRVKLTGLLPNEDTWVVVKYDRPRLTPRQ